MISLAQQTCITDKHLAYLSRCMLHGIHSVFLTKEVTEYDRGDAMSEKKLTKGEGVWAHVKEILGWNFDGINYTIQLPLDKVKRS